MNSNTDAGEYSGIKGTGIVLDGLDEDRDYYLQVSTVSKGRTSDPSPIHYAFGVAAPLALNASDRSDNAFTANWQKAPKATSYTVDLFKVTKMSKDVPGNTVLTESFSKVECGATPGKPKSIGNSEYIAIDEYADQKGWIGSGLVIADGMVGCAANSAYDLVSPFITLGNNNGDYTVEISAYTQAGCTLVVEGFKGYAVHTFETTGTESFSLDIPGGLMKDRLVIYSLNGKTFLIDDITVKQDVAKDDLILSHIKSVEADGETTSLRFDNLGENADSYAYAVTSHRKKYTDNTTSLLSNVVCVASGNGSVLSTSTGDTVTTDGLMVTITTEQGGRLLIVAADGTTVTAANVASGTYSYRLPQLGVYIIRFNDTTVKTAAR